MLLTKMMLVASVITSINTYAFTVGHVPASEWDRFARASTLFDTLKATAAFLGHIVDFGFRGNSIFPKVNPTVALYRAFT